MAHFTLHLLDDTQVFVDLHAQNQKVLDFANCYNPGAAVVYLNIWPALEEPVGTPTEAAADRICVVPIGPGFSGTVPLDLIFAAGAIVSATTGTNATGDPGTDELEIALHWTGG